jgi:hypothetical protein
MMDWQTTFWNGGNPRQALYNKLKAELIPGNGHSKTLEGECLRAFAKIEHDAYNNGGGNNHSGALRFLKENLPGFKQQWWDTLHEYVVFGGVNPSIKVTISEIGEAVVSHVESMPALTPLINEPTIEQLYAEYLGLNGPEERPVSSYFTDDEEEDEMTWSRRR